MYYKRALNCVVLITCACGAMPRFESEFGEFIEIYQHGSVLEVIDDLENGVEWSKALLRPCKFIICSERK